MTLTIEQKLRKMIRNEIRNVIIEQKTDFSKVSTPILKKMIDILGKDYNKKTKEEKELLHQIQIIWAKRKDNNE